MKYNRSLKNMEKLDEANRTRLADIAKPKFDGWYQQAANDIAGGLKI